MTGVLFCFMALWVVVDSLKSLVMFGGGEYQKGLCVLFFVFQFREEAIERMECHLRMEKLDVLEVGFFKRKYLKGYLNENEDVCHWGN